jgi:hypothetical protein
MATQIKVGIDDKEVILNAADAASLIETQDQIMAEQNANELEAKNLLASKKSAVAKLQKLGLTLDEANSLFGLSLIETQTPVI